jgi:hypothetical protein
VKSRYIHTHRSNLRRKPQSRKLQGAFEDDGRWIKCWHCGFPIDTERMSTGPGHGNVYTEVSEATLDSEDWKTKILTIDPSGSIGTILELGADGNPITAYYTPRKSQAVSGCPLCGCKNLP